MSVTSKQTTSETGPRLRVIVGLLSFAAVVDIVVHLTRLARPVGSDWLAIVALTVLIGLSNLLILRIRREFLVNWTDSAVLVAAATLPMPWLVVATAVSVTLVKVIQRRPPIKFVFAVAKETVVATVGGAILATGAFEHLTAGDQLDNLPRLSQLGLAFGAMVVVDEILSTPVIAISSGTPISRAFKDNVNRKISLSVIRFGVAIVTLVILLFDPRLIVAIPPLVLSLHFMHKNRLRERAERDAWQRLARATDALNEVDLAKVLRAAVDTGVTMFGAEWVEVEVSLPGTARTYYGDRTGMLPDAPDPARAEGKPTVVVLEGQRGSEDVGELRLFFARPTMLAERETFLLSSFAAALATAIRNARAYGMLTSVADRHAHDAQHDQLTGLANRRRLVEVGTAALEEHGGGGTIALLTVDIHQFKEINESLGYQAGDETLVEVGRRMSEAAGDGVLIARQGADEFAALYTGLPTPALAVHRARELLQAVAADYEVDGVPITLVLRGGLAVAPADGDMEELMRRASLALIEAKRTGQRLVPYSRSLDRTDIDRIELGGQISRAVAASEFTIEFQPIVDLATGRTVSAEALARWHHPDYGNLDPRRFLDTVERSGQLTPFTEAILDQALSAAGIWAAAGHPIPVAVNVSPRSLLDRRFPALVQEVLDERGMSPDSLVLELTESLTISSMDIVDQVLAGLGRIGVAIALDDFGTGFSSMTALARVPVKELKIDRSFVTDMDSSAQALAVVRSTIELGRALGLTVVAEGIERVDQRRTLYNLGCHLGQGHLFARPLSQQRFVAALVRGQFAEALHEEGSVVRLPRPGEHFGQPRRSGRSSE